MITKMTKWLNDNNPNLSPWEKFVRKLSINMQMADPIDWEAENQCDWVDFGCEYMSNIIRRTSRSWDEEQACLCWLHGEAESQKYCIHQQAENAKRQRDELERVRWLLSTNAPRQPMFYSCSNQFSMG